MRYELLMKSIFYKKKINFFFYYYFKKHYLEPKIKLAEEIKKLNLDENCFVTIEHGKTISTKD
jgi:hypothetical protein